VTIRWRQVGGSDDASEDEKPTLEAVLDHYDVRIPGSGRGMTNCPLHEDRTPSLSVDTDKGVWNCHSCGNGGDSYALLMQKEEIDFVGARALAASLALTTGSVGGGDDELSGSRYGGRRKVPARKGDRPRDGGYVPAWRRR
jgi:hypothetical protein